MSNQKLMPLLSLKNSDLFTKEVNSKTEKEIFIFNVKYLEGSPRQYRADMSKAIININGREIITAPKDDFSFAPFAYRYFEESLFGKEEKFWCEFFFLNEALQVCSIMFHQYTAQAFKQHFADYLYYDDLTPCECVFTVRFEEKKAEVEENGKKVTKIYHIGSFKSKPIDAETKDAFFTLVDCLPPVYREDTLKEFARPAIQAENYKRKMSNTAWTIIQQAEQRRIDAMLEEFDRTSIDLQPSESSNAATATSRVLAAGRNRR